MLFIIFSALAYRVDGKHTKAAEVLTNGAKLISESNSDKSFSLFSQAIDIYMEENVPQFAEDTFSYYVNALGRAEKWSLALTELPKRIEINRKMNRQDTINKTILSLVIISLSQGRVKGANQVLSTYIGDQAFSMSDDCMLAGQLISAVQMEDPDSLKQVLKNQYFTFLPNSVTKLAKKIDVEGAVNEDDDNDKDDKEQDNDKDQKNDDGHEEQQEDVDDDGTL
ncbi:MAG: hypothetical protein EZS28_036787 [Streblomastix strix]|uniref:Gamma-soluble NSF attachment protein n=1 Tax=Streblomastix strix TaxID=222440 RepID=A0A5J4U9V6_9EUKA|nr:MAG: hypothetical protein EZS28_036787 [Streblomastix strix]